MMEAYREMLTYIKSAVTRNYSEKCINSIMDYVSGSASQNFGLLQETDTLAYLLVVILFDPIKRKEKHSWFIKKKKKKTDHGIN